MQYIIAFFIFFIIINVIGWIFAFLWPLLLALIVVVAISSYFAYRKRKKAMEEFYQDVNDTFQQRDGQDFYDQDRASSSDDIIDVEFTETDADEDR